MPALADIKRLLAELDPTDSQSIPHFGAKAQQQLTEVSEQMLEGARTKDTGPAGEALNSMVGQPRVRSWPSSRPIRARR